MVGEALIDEIERNGSIERHPGGSPANVALTLARLDARPALLSHWGSDSAGEIITDHLESARVTIVAGSCQSGKTSTARATIDDSGAANYDFHINWDPQTTADLSDTCHFHTGSIAAVLTPGAQTVAHMAKALHADATVSIDPNARPQLLGETASPHPAAFDQLAELLDLADIVKASDEDIAYFAPDQSESEFVAECFQRGATIVVITAGASGVRGYLRGETIQLEPFTVQVADTVGAGDALMGGLLDALRHLGMLGDRARLQQIDAAQLRAALTWAQGCAALTVAQAGANPPASPTLRSFLAAHNQSVSW